MLKMPVTAGIQYQEPAHKHLSKRRYVCVANLVNEVRSVITDPLVRIYCFSSVNEREMAETGNLNTNNATI